MQLCRSTPHRGQKHKPSRLDEVSVQRCHVGIEAFFLWILVVSFLNNKTQKGHGKGLKKKMKKDLRVAKALTLQYQHIFPQTRCLKTDPFKDH